MPIWSASPQPGRNGWRSGRRSRPSCPTSRITNSKAPCSGWPWNRKPRRGVAADTVAAGSYLGLTGTNVLVNENDSGVDTNHPDLFGQVLLAPGDGASGHDTNGHGTHVAGIIASSGGQSLTVTNALGSIMPPTNAQFRGMAPAASLFAMSADLTFGPATTDTYLQETAARTNAFISNNSWHFFS